MRKLAGCLVVMFALAFAVSCDDEDTDKKKKKKDDKKAKAEKKGKDGKGKPGAGKEPEAGEVPRAVVPPPTGEKVNLGPADIKGFTRWKPVPVFVSEKVTDVAALGNNEAMALTKDGHVGVTKDGGKSWHFQRLFHGDAAAVHGKAGGPYFAVGEDGYVARSKDGLVWKDLPLVTDTDLIDVGVTPNHAVAIGKSTVVTYGLEGKKWVVFEMPKGKRPKKVHVLGKRAFLQVGKEAWASKDNGQNWFPMQTALSLPTGKDVQTTQGICKLGNIPKSRGMICTVKGTGFAISANDIFVVAGDTVNGSRDGGKTWRVAKLPFNGVTQVKGKPGGPFFAVGRRGGLARSANGAAWNLKQVDSKSTLNDILVMGDRVLVVGAGGTVLLSKDGGKSFSKVEVQPKRTFNYIVKKGSAILLPAGPGVMVSKDSGDSFAEAPDKAALGDIPPRPRVANCTGSLPTAGTACKMARQATSPLGLPRLRMFDFRGDFGIAGGDYGLVVVTVDGGASWNAKYGLPIKKGIQDLQVKGKLAVVVGKSAVVYSKDGGKKWRVGLLPKKTGALNGAHIDDDGKVYVAGDRGTLLKSVGSFVVWAKLAPDPKNKTSFVRVMRAGKGLFAAGSKGQLYRSEDRGRTWTYVPTAQSQPIVKMVAKDNLVLAVVPTYRRKGWAKYKGSNLLLRSDNGGKNFYVQSKLSFRGDVTDFHFDANGQLIYDDMVSADLGLTWSKFRAHHWGNSVPIRDGTNRFLRNWRSGYFRDILYVIGKTHKRWTIINHVYHEDGFLRCGPKAGCWMVCDSTVYRPF